MKHHFSLTQIRNSSPYTMRMTKMLMISSNLISLDFDGRRIVVFDYIQDYHQHCYFRSKIPNIYFQGIFP